MASISGANKIVLKGSYSEGGSEHGEGIAVGTIYPGMNIVMSNLAAATQGRDYWAAGSTDYVGTGTSRTSTQNPVRIAKEDNLGGTPGLAGIGKTITDAYVNGDNIFHYYPKNGDILQVLVASGQTVLKGDTLSAGADGRWVTDLANGAVEALEPSAGALGADTLVRVRCL